MKLVAPISAAILTLIIGFSSANADDLQKIKDAGEMSCALSGAFPPFSFVDEQNNVVGFDVDICNAVAQELGVKAKVVTTAWDGILAGLVTGRYDTIIGSMGVSEERQKAVDFTNTYYHSGLAIFVSEGSQAKGVADLEGKTIGVTLGELGEEWAQKRGGWTLRTYKGLPELLLELQAGRIDAIVTDDVPVLVAVKDKKANLRMIEAPDLPKWDVAVALRKDNPELKEAINKAIASIRESGKYLEISNKWVGSDIY